MSIKKARVTSTGGAKMNGFDLAAKSIKATPNCSIPAAQKQSHFQDLIDQAVKFGAIAADRGDCERIALHYEVWHSLQCAANGLHYQPLFGRQS